MQKYTLIREVKTGEGINVDYRVATLAMYDTKQQAMAALYGLAGVLGVQVKFKKDDLGGDPAIWCYTVTDHAGADYYLTIEEVDEDGNIMDPFDMD